jgi:protein TonB
VVTWLQAHRTYPPEAQRRGEQGAAVVRLTVARDGRVRTFTLMQGTGSPRLDAAVEALLSHAELPPFPASMPQPEATIQIPIRYQLTS